MDAVADGRGITPPVGRLYPLQGRNSGSVTHSRRAWWVVEAIDKKRARLNCINYVLTRNPYGGVERAPVVLPDRMRHEDHERHPIPRETHVPDLY